MENWVGESDALKLFAKHYKTGEVIPDDLIAVIREVSVINPLTNGTFKSALNKTLFLSIL